MRHRVDGRLFGRTANQRKALLKGLVTSLLEHERIETTEAKAKEVRRIAEKIRKTACFFISFKQGISGKAFQ
ncbi:MAG: rplQ [Nitrospirae bacterium]|nr:rplQ [Nitrospirota bacterium]